MEDNPIAIDLIRVKQDSFGNSVITLACPTLPFYPGQVLQANIYNDYIMIRAALPEDSTH